MSSRTVNDHRIDLGATVSSGLLDDSVWQESHDHPGFDMATQFDLPEEDGIEDGSAPSTPEMSKAAPTQATVASSSEPPLRLRNAPAASGSASMVLPVNDRYVTLMSEVAEATQTIVEGQHALDGLPQLMGIAGVSLHQAYPIGGESDIWLCAFVVNAWQLYCHRYQTGMPKLDSEYPLSTNFASYFLAACSIMGIEDATQSSDTNTSNQQALTATRATFERAVNYWNGLVHSSGANSWWMNKYLFKHLVSFEPICVVVCNEVSLKYLRLLHNYGVPALALRILTDEITRVTPDGPASALRRVSPNSLEFDALLEDTIAMLISMDRDVLESILDGSLSRKREIPGTEVSNALNRIEARPAQPGTYRNVICDLQGYSPTPSHWMLVTSLMLQYVARGHSGDSLAASVDQIIHPSGKWPVRLAAKGLRRYTEYTSYIVDEDPYSCDHRRRIVTDFALAMDNRCLVEKGQGRAHVPLSSPVDEVGFSNDPRRRLAQHRKHESSNYLMNLSEALFEYVWPGKFRLQQCTIYSCWTSEQCWMSEIFLTLLSQGYVQGGNGFNHHPAGHSNGGAYTKVPERSWVAFRRLAHRDGFAGKLDAALQFSARLDNERQHQASCLEASQRQMVQHDQDICCILDAITDCCQTLQEF